MERASVEEKIKEITDKIVREHQPEKIILFGSWAWGTPHEDSDVDLFIIKDTDRSTREVAREIDGSLWGRLIPIDILVYTHKELEDSVNRDGNLFLEDIIRNGRVLYDARPTDPVRLEREPAEIIA